jgi:hypothetical protein
MVVVVVVRQFGFQVSGTTWRYGYSTSDWVHFQRSQIRRISACGGRTGHTAYIARGKGRGKNGEEEHSDHLFHYCCLE